MTTTSPERRSARKPATRKRKPANDSTQRRDITAKKSVTLPVDQIAEVEALTGPRGFSAAVSDALAQWIALERTFRFLDEYEASAGAFTDQEIAEAEARWAKR
jgi:hypothetical protein